MATDLPPDLVAKVRPFVRGKTVLYVSNRKDKALRKDLERKLGIQIKTWSCNEDVTIDCRRVKSGSYDVVVVATYFCGVSSGRSLKDAAKDAGIPFVDAHKGRVSATAAGMVHGMRIDLNAPPPPRPKPKPIVETILDESHDDLEDDDTSFDFEDLPELPPIEDPTIPTEKSDLTWKTADLMAYIEMTDKVSMQELLEEALSIPVKPESDGKIKWGKYAAVTNKVSTILTNLGWEKWRIQEGVSRFTYWVSPEYQEKNVSPHAPPKATPKPNPKTTRPAVAPSASGQKRQSFMGKPLLALTDGVAKRVRELRTLRGWSQYTLGDQAGVTQNTVSRVERAFGSVSRDSVIAIAEALGTTLYDLSEQSEPEPIRAVTAPRTPAPRTAPQPSMLHSGMTGEKKVHLNVSQISGDLNELISLLTASGWKVTFGA